ncbi:MAG TPA: ABC transporter permease [Anaerohalosphaeraceae bacterium]|jgi:peptide/nickel transport system permease protein|nr:ABC transporter permease [Anaerohalosphaeraceae bacterium]HRT50115.1 ABC transporter permease [Anaerohalosphaeraceae bacterium]HRT86049.1 ABC transporter permease [Anaerohalosphaeraceae bacterium]
MTEPTITLPQPQASSENYWRYVWRNVRRNRRGLAGLIVIAAMLAVWIFSPLLATNQPIVCKYNGRWYFPAVIEIFQSRGAGPHWIEKPRPFNLPQFDAKKELDPEAFAIWPLIPYHEYEQSTEFLQPPSSRHWLGTDELGRDLAARMIHGAAVSVKVGFVSMGIAAVIGILMGGLAGYWGGLVDMLISRVIEIVVCFPVFFLILAIMVWLEPNIVNVMIVIGLTRWTSIARYTRGEFMRIKGQDYVTAARALGIGHARIMFRHILPNALAPILVSVTFGIADAVLVEAGLSWLGFGVQPPDPSWGNILRTAYDSLNVAPHMVYPPCIAIFLAVLAYNLVGDALRDAIDPRLRGTT